MSVTVRKLYFFTRSVPRESWSVYSLPSTLDRLAARRLLIPHIENLIARPQILLRRSMTLQAPLHLQRRLVIHQRHAVHRAVAGVAAYAFIDMNAVIEIDEVGQIIHPGPDQRFAGLVALAHRLEQGALVQICAWQFMQVLVGGIPAKLDVSTEV